MIGNEEKINRYDETVAKLKRQAALRAEYANMDARDGEEQDNAVQYGMLMQTLEMLNMLWVPAKAKHEEKDDLFWVKTVKIGGETIYEYGGER